MSVERKQFGVMSRRLKAIDDEEELSEDLDQGGEPERSSEEPESSDEEELEDEELDDIEEDEEDNAEDGLPSDEEEGSVSNEENLTARQRAKINGSDVHVPDLADLADRSFGGRKKKVLSVEEEKIKRAELARRRRNLSERRLEEEKQGTLDKLLKRRATKTRKDEQTQAQGEAKLDAVKRHPALSTWRSSRSGMTLSVAQERADYMFPGL